MRLRNSILSLSALLMLGCSSRPVPAPVIELYKGKTYEDFEKAEYQSGIYEVKAGDTLFAIAWFSGQEYRDIARWNNISPPYDIFPGQKLVVEKPAEKTAKKTPTQTKKTTVKTAVDRTPEQAYGGVKGKGRRVLAVRQPGDFPSRVRQWLWPSEGKLIGRYAANQKGRNGIDIQAPRGTHVVASAEGKVVYTGNALRGYGNLVIIKHTETFLTAYAHNENVLVKEQEWVKAGQKIASMGSSGTNDVKLRFEVRYKGNSVDPLRYLPAK